MCGTSVRFALFLPLLRGTRIGVMRIIQAVVSVYGRLLGHRMYVCPSSHARLVGPLSLWERPLYTRAVQESPMSRHGVLGGAGTLTEALGLISRSVCVFLSRSRSAAGQPTTAAPARRSWASCSGRTSVLRSRSVSRFCVRVCSPLTAFASRLLLNYDSAWRHVLLRSVPGGAGIAAVTCGSISLDMVNCGCEE